MQGGPCCCPCSTPRAGSKQLMLSQRGASQLSHAQHKAITADAHAGWPVGIAAQCTPSNANEQLTPPPLPTGQQHPDPLPKQPSSNTQAFARRRCRVVPRRSPISRQAGRPQAPRPKEVEKEGTAFQGGRQTNMVGCGYFQIRTGNIQK